MGIALIIYRLYRTQRSQYPPPAPRDAPWVGPCGVQPEGACDVSMACLGLALGQGDATHRTCHPALDPAARLSIHNPTCSRPSRTAQCPPARGRRRRIHRPPRTRPTRGSIARVAHHVTHPRRSVELIQRARGLAVWLGQRLATASLLLPGSETASRDASSCQLQPGVGRRRREGTPKMSWGRARGGPGGDAHAVSS